MELKDFIVSAINDISSAVKEADNEIQLLGGMVNPGTHEVVMGPSKTTDYEFVFPRTTLHFDIAVSASTESKKGAKAKTRIWVVEASLDGGEDNKSESVSRLTFSLDVVLPSDSSQTKRLGKVRKPAS